MPETPKTHPKDSTSTQTLLEKEPVWNVVVMNDPVNLMSYVVLVFKRVLGFDETRARKHMLEVHRNGRSVVWTGHREEAELYVNQLQHWQLTALLEPES